MCSGRMESARSKGELADQAAAQARADADRAKMMAKEIEQGEQRQALEASRSQRRAG